MRPLETTTPDSPAARVNPSDIPMTRSRTVALPLKCRSTCGVCGIALLGTTLDRPIGTTGQQPVRVNHVWNYAVGSYAMPAPAATTFELALDRASLPYYRTSTVSDPMRLQHDAPRSIPLRRQPTESVTYVGERGGGPRERVQVLPSGRALADFLDPNRVTRAIQDLGRSGYRPLAARSDGGLTPRPQGLHSPPHGGTRETAKTGA